MFSRLRLLSTVTVMVPVPAVLNVAVSVSLVLDVEPGIVLLAQLPDPFQAPDDVDVQVLLLCARAAGARRSVEIDTNIPIAKGRIRGMGQKFFFISLET